MCIKDADQEEVELWAMMMREECNTGDHEFDHANGDELLCELLIYLGYGAVVKEYKKLVRWCA